MRKIIHLLYHSEGFEINSPLVSLSKEPRWTLAARFTA
jgi:hypothetical protein